MPYDEIPPNVLKLAEMDEQARKKRAQGLSDLPPTDSTPWPTLNSVALHGLAGDIVRTIEPHSEADPVALLIQTLVAFGSVVGRGPHALAEADEHHMNLFTVLVGETSKGRKGTSWSHIRKLFKATDSTWVDRIQAGLSSGEGLIWAVRDPIEKIEAIREQGKPTGEHRTVLMDPGVEDKRLLVIEAEFASTLRVLGRDGNTLSAIVRQAWDTGDLRTLVKHAAAVSTGSYVSIIGHVTKDELVRYLDRTEAGNGFGNRFLWVCVQRSKTLPEGGRMEQVDMAPYVRELSAAVKFACGVDVIRRDDRSRAIWAEIYGQLSEGKPGLFGAVTSRSEAQVLRLSDIYALLDRSNQVREEHLSAALALWKYCEDSARYIFGDSMGDRIADEILTALRSTPGGLTRNSIYRDLFKGNVKELRIKRALGKLVARKMARVETEETGGRPAERWFADSAGYAINAFNAKRGDECD